MINSVNILQNYLNEHTYSYEILGFNKHSFGDKFEVKENSPFGSPVVYTLYVKNNRVYNENFQDCLELNELALEEE